MKRAVILGVGGLGCPAALALAESDADLELVLIDDDRVERSNLARQILFRAADVGQQKAEVAARRLRAQCGASRPGTDQVRLRVQSLAVRFQPENAAEILRGADVVLDGTDNFESRFLANDAAAAARVPLVHGAVLGWTGQLLTILPGRTACLRCFFEGPPPPGALPTCAQAGVASPLCGVVGAAMAAAALAVLRGTAEGNLLQRWDGLRCTRRPLRLRPEPGCSCGIL